jgi:DNA-binding transcriptional LysR family regulator
MMELRHLRYFVVLAQELHFGRAASRLAITQPPLSFNIKQLEDELGVILLDRDNKHAALTQAGRAFYEEAMAILSRADRAKELAKAVGAGRLGRLDVGFSGSMIYMHFPAITERYRKAYPEVDLVLHEFGLPDQTAALFHGQLDLGFVDAPGVPEELDGMKLREEPYYCCVATGHRLAGVAAVDLADLADEPFVSFNRLGSPTNFDRLAGMCAAAGFTAKVSHAVRQWITIMELVSHNYGVALVPERMLRAQLHGVRFIPLISSNPVTSTGFLLWNPSRINERIRRFVDAAKAEIAENSSV